MGDKRASGGDAGLRYPNQDKPGRGGSLAAGPRTSNCCIKGPAEEVRLAIRHGGRSADGLKPAHNPSEAMAIEDRKARIVLLAKAPLGFFVRNETGAISLVSWKEHV